MESETDTAIGAEVLAEILAGKFDSGDKLEEQALDESLKKHKKIEEQVKTRIEESNTNTGLRDWMFNAAGLVVDLKEIVEPEVLGFRMMMESISEAAETLSDENWNLFSHLIFNRIHKQDQDVHTQLFSKTEPSWKQTMTMPKTGKTCVFLHIGTSPPSEHLCKLFSRLGWFGVSIAPTKPPGFDDCISSFELDPGSHNDDEEFKLLCRKKEGKVPKPETFPLVYVNLVFFMDTLEPDSEEEDELPPEVATRWEDFEDSMPKTPKASDEPDVNIDKKKGAKGYGKLGVTRTTHVRRRLRAIRNSMAVALQRLGDKGTLVICWPGLPYHPVLMFVVSYLRTLFQRLHLIVQENTVSTFELYILCAGFNREVSQTATIGSNGIRFKSFMESQYRRNGVDDVLMWTLTDKDLFSEARIGAGGGRSMQKSWNDVWTAYSRKFKSLIHTLGFEVPATEKKKKPAPVEPPKEHRDPKKDAKDKHDERRAALNDKRAAKEKEKDKEKEKTKSGKAADEAKANDEDEQKTADDGSRDKAAGTSGAKDATKLPPVGDVDPARSATPEERGADSDCLDSMTSASKVKSHKQQRNRLILSRSLPSLASSVGACPGSDFAKGANATVLAAKWPLLKYGLRRAEEAAIFG